MTAALALASALSFGAADFLGGLVSRRVAALTVTFLSQASGVLVLLPALVLLEGRPSPPALAWGALAGVMGAGGLALYLRSLAIGPMGVVAPLAAVVGAALPVALGLLAGERPTVPATVGIACGIVAVALASRPARTSAATATGVTGPVLALAAGVGFGLFFVALDATPSGSGAWPLVGARGASVAVLVAVLALLRRPFAPRAAVPLAAVSGALDMLANLLFLAATRIGLLTVAAVVTSLYPVVVVLLARQVLAERLAGHQRAGVVLSLAAVALIAAG